MPEKRTVLAIDDSKVALLNIERQLADTDFDVVATARSGPEALEQYDAHKPDVVLLDVVMPGVGGVELLAEIRFRDPAATIIMVSSLGTKEKVMECMEKGATSFLMKPFEKDDLISTLKRAVEEQA